MTRSICFLGIVSMASVALLTNGASRPGGRTLSLVEQQAIRGGTSGYCCGVPTNCQLPSPNLDCNQYTYSQCSGTKYWLNPAGSSIYDCVIIVPSGFCSAGTTTNPCLAYKVCIWDSTEGVCFPSTTSWATANCPSSCGDIGCT